ncbi:D-alanine--D-alanine ligase [Candidatus Daviesbacteria bacterium]|nr:D-alanine--D-alanine ligase [Candidatus Daviesbacteria bacterium]
MKKLVVGLFFGGRSVEHEVSVVSALQAYENLDKDKYEVIPIYVGKDGKFYSHPAFLDIKNYKDIDQLLLSATQLVPAAKNNQTGLMTTGMLPKLKQLDVVLPIFHGTFGEDGAMQGVFDIYQIPYVGLSVTGSALSMDKILQKPVYKELGLIVGKYFWFRRNEWFADNKKVLKQIQEELKFPMFVKPASIGSSIGINKASDEDALGFAIEVASAYSDKLLIEEAFEGCIEVNCSALGYRDIYASVCEMPVASSDILSFADKYMKGGKGSKGAGSPREAGMASLTRVIPAPISAKLAKEIQEATIKVFRAFDGCGVIRVDYFVDKEKEKFWINEVNPIPGSLSFYLWNKTPNPFKEGKGTLEYPELLDKLIEFALQRAEDQKKTQYTFESGLLQRMALKSGSKN